ncbi:MAG: phosphatase PAP2 family protein [Burkholderiales bacterium]
MSAKYYCQTGFWVTLGLMGLTLFSVLMIDKPLALWIHFYHIDKWLILHHLSEQALIVVSIAYLIMLTFKSVDSDFGRRIWLILYIIIIVCLTLWFKTKLKIMLGRDWPSTWSGSHQSLLQHEVYRFNLFQPGTWQGSLPSGHMTFASSTSVIMYLLYPQYKYIWFGCIGLLTASLVMLNYHFLGDCLAGIALGAFAAYYSMAFYLLLRQVITKSKQSIV